MTYTRGLSLVSILVSLAIIASISFFILDVFTEYNARQSLLTDTAQVTSLLREARERTLTSDKRSQYGVYVSATGTELFRGGVYDSSLVEEKHLFSPSVMATTTFSGGASVVFERLTGEVLNAGTIVLYLRSATTTIRTISISPSGLIGAE